MKVSRKTFKFRHSRENGNPVSLPFRYLESLDSRFPRAPRMSPSMDFLRVRGNDGEKSGCARRP